MANQTPRRIVSFEAGIEWFTPETALAVLDGSVEGRGLQPKLCTDELCSLRKVGQCPSGGGSPERKCCAWLPAATSVARLEGKLIKQVDELTEQARNIQAERLNARARMRAG